MKLGRLVDGNLLQSILKLANAPLPIKVAFRLKGIVKTIREESAKYEEVRQEALNRYGIKNEDGSLKLDDRSCVTFTDEGVKAFSKELNELAQLEIEVPQITLSELGDKIMISLQELEILDGIIVE